MKNLKEIYYISCLQHINISFTIGPNISASVSSLKDISLLLKNLNILKQFECKDLSKEQITIIKEAKWKDQIIKYDYKLPEQANCDICKKETKINFLYYIDEKKKDCCFCGNTFVFVRS